MRWAFTALVLAACDSAAAPSESSTAPPVSAAPSASSSPRPLDAGQVHQASEALRGCASAAGPLASIADAVARINALPRPVDGSCFVAALPRPLAVVATTGTISAQPSAGKQSPRLFFLLPALVVSSVPEGDGSKVLEFGQWTTPVRTLKGEIALPVTSTLPSDSAFQHVLRGDRTICATCHREEELHPTIPNAFISAAFKPELGTFVTVEALEAFHETCTREDDPSARCAMFHAIFDFGEVTQGAFAKDVATFIGP